VLFCWAGGADSNHLKPLIGVLEDGLSTGVKAPRFAFLSLVWVNNVAQTGPNVWGDCQPEEISALSEPMHFELIAIDGF